MKKILFVAYGGGHINIIDLVAQKLLNDADVKFTILALTTAYNKVVNKYPKSIVKKVSDYRHLFETELSAIEAYGNELLSENYNKNSGISKEDTIMYLGCSMYDLVHKYGEKEAKELYAIKKRQAFLPLETMKKIIHYEKCDIVVSTTSPRFEQASFIAANQLGIQTVEILDLFGELYPLPEAQHIICMNENVAKRLREQGLMNRNFYHFGQPVIEESTKQILRVDKNKIYNKIQLQRDKRTLLYASQIPVLHNKDCTYNSKLDYKLANNAIFDLFYLLNNNFEVNILFRLHPNEDLNNYSRYFKEYEFIKFINDDLSLHESIAISDAVITPYSTVAIEALAASKVVFTYKNDFDQCYPISEMKCKPFIFSNGFEELENNLSTYLSNPSKVKEVEDFLPKNSVENIIKLLRDL